MCNYTRLGPASPGSLSQVELACKREGPWVKSKRVTRKWDSQTDLDPKDQGPGSASIWGSSSLEEGLRWGFPHQAGDAKGSVPSLSGSVKHFPFLAGSILGFKEERFGRDGWLWAFGVPSPGSQKGADAGKGVGMWLRVRQQKTAATRESTVPSTNSPERGSRQRLHPTPATSQRHYLQQRKKTKLHPYCPLLGGEGGWLKSWVAGPASLP